jgi:hypothetical protein
LFSFRYRYHTATQHIGVNIRVNPYKNTTYCA